MGESTINGVFSTAMLVYQRVIVDFINIYYNNPSWYPLHTPHMAPGKQPSWMFPACQLGEHEGLPSILPICFPSLSHNFSFSHSFLICFPYISHNFQFSHEFPMIVPEMSHKLPRIFGEISGFTSTYVDRCCSKLPVGLRLWGGSDSFFGTLWFWLLHSHGFSMALIEIDGLPFAIKWVDFPWLFYNQMVIFGNLHGNFNGIGPSKDIV